MFSLLADFASLFPTKKSAGIFFFYIFLFVNQGIFITASQKSGNVYLYNTIVAVLLTEVVKFIISIILYSINNYSCLSVFTEGKKNVTVFCLYFIPAALYCIYNNLTYINLATFDPTTYFLLMQLRVVITGFIFQFLFKKVLSRKQWISLVILTVGCMLKQVHFGDESTKPVSGHLTKESNMSWSIGTIFLLLQVFCSCTAGVYNEYLLKRQGADVDVYLQNIFMYLDSIICNFGVLAVQGNLDEIFSYEILHPFTEFKVILVVLNSAAIGIVTSFFLRYLNSILKTFASALELSLTALFSRIIFGIPIYLNTVLAIFFVIAATLMYSQNPVNNQEMTNKTSQCV